MPLYFTDKKKHWPPPKAVQYILAAIALVAAIGILTAWLLVRFVYSDPDSAAPSATTGKTNLTTTTQSQVDLPETGFCLFIIEDNGYERFALIECAPTDGNITVRYVPATLLLSNGQTVTQTYQRTNAAQVTKDIATHYQIPLAHYISFSITEVESLVSRWGGSLPMTPPEEIKMGTAVLPAEQRAMTPQQISAMLRYTQWKDAQNRDRLIAEIVAAFINHTLTPNCNLNQIYSAIADHSSIRVHHFNAFYDGLAYLSSLNEGAIAQCE